MQPGHYFDQCAFAGAIFAHQGMNLSREEEQGHSLQDARASKGFININQLNRGLDIHEHLSVKKIRWPVFFIEWGELESGDASIQKKMPD
jgi:hypothetical protein